ncbi:alpha/beta fold hydrolase [Amycolatopsis aidingensis]|uniref:alpha/beta fold hydrolase n=1 Tax=Amycolatopsis aidingensis TaxID=2842453 RepID=UPI001C0C6350|nr:alpha/beta fold hydrolase [Amycolatopsis aidingensis]
MSTLTHAGITIDYQDEGSGDPLLLVHGHPFDRSMWRPQVSRFAGAGWRVITADLRGYGRSTVVPGSTPLETFARDLVGLLDRLGIDRVVLGGLSMGGQIVLEFHRLFPARLRGLVLASTSARADPPATREWRRTTADRLLREGLGPYAEEVIDKMVAPHNIRELPEVAGQVLAMMKAAPPEGAAAALRGRAERPDYLPMLAGVAVPTLVVVGTEDEFTPVAEARLMHERIPGSVLCVIEGAAHLPNLERPAEFDAALERFLAGL